LELTERTAKQLKNLSVALWPRGFSSGFCSLHSSRCCSLFAGVAAFPLPGDNPYVAQTRYCWLLVAAGMMMIVGDSAARRFGIFAGGFASSLPY